MLKKCRCPHREDILLEYKIELGKFYVSSSFENAKLNEEVKLTGYFYKGDTLTEFDFGIYTDEQGVLSLNKSYSLSYLEDNSILPDKLSHFSVVSSQNFNYTLYPEDESNQTEDASLTRAKKALDNIKDGNKCCENMELLLESIGRRLNNYAKVSLPFMPEFSWYKISNSDECFNLSSVKHLKQSESFSFGKPWYFGQSCDERICAFAASGKRGSVNPLSNADDCTVSYVSSLSDKAYYVVGILLLDDGQYFCRLD